MSHETDRGQLSKARVLYSLPAMDQVTVRRDETYRVDGSGPLTFDVSYPPGSTDDTARPAVLFVTGFPDAGAEMMFGAKFKNMGSFESWAQLVAASGLVGITYANSEPGDVRAILHHIRQHAAALGIDGNRIGIWACSGHGPTALSLLMDDSGEPLACAVLAYPYTLDLDDATGVADAARQFRFATPAAGRTPANLARVPLFVARAGRDVMPGLNASLDRFIAAALALNLPITLTNHPTGPHAFDLLDATQPARDVVAQMLSFLTTQLSG